MKVVSIAAAEEWNPRYPASSQDGRK